MNKPALHRPHPATVRIPDDRGSAASRGYGYRWRKVRIEYLRANPLCVRCLEVGITEPATQVDHIIALAKGGPDALGNYQSLCGSCHSSKTAREDRR